jgi:hypothetical protein
VDSLDELMNRSARAGIRMLADGDRLVVRGPKEAAPIVEEIRRRKDEVLSIFYPSAEDLLCAARALGFPPCITIRTTVPGSEAAWRAAANGAPRDSRAEMYEALEELEDRERQNASRNVGTPELSSL